MFKIIIESDDGRRLDMSKESYISFRNSDGKETYWEWEHLEGNTDKYEQIFTAARAMLDRIPDLLPDIPMTGYR